MRPLVFFCCGLVPLAAMADWKLQHAEDFAHASGIDASYWSLETGFRRNKEEQYYQPANVTVGDGVLRIEARHEEVPNAEYRAGARAWRQSRRVSKYTSGSLVGNTTFLYGRVEVVARAPTGAGVWPALWLVHESAGNYGEIDFFEAVGKHPDTAFAAVHHGREPDKRQYKSEYLKIPGMDGRWHVHTVEWTPQRIVAAIDGKTLLQFEPASAAQAGSDPLRKPMRLRINLALGGTWAGPIDESKLPARFEIASLRVWNWQPGADDSITPPTLPADAAAPAAPATAPEQEIRMPRWGR